MASLLERLRILSRELRRRRVYRAAVLYTAAGFALLQGADLAVGARVLPEWTVPVGVVLVAVGFPVAVSLAWAFQLTPGGIRSDAAAHGGHGGWLVRGVVVGVALFVSGALAWSSWILWVRPSPAPVFAEAASEAETGSRAADPARVAVLYFDDHSPGNSLGYLAAGLTENLLHELAQVPALEVVSRNAVKAYRDGEISLPALVESLDIGSIVEGSVSRSNGRIKVAVQLVDAESGAHLASRILERPEGELFTLEDELAHEMGRILRERLGVEIRRDEWRSAARSGEAWTLLHRAAELQDEYKRLWKLNPDAGVRGLLAVDSMLAEAERLDPRWLELPLARGWGTGGIQTSLSLLGPEDTFKVIDQGADESVNAANIRRLAENTADVTTSDTATVDFANQSSGGSVVTVDSVYLPEGGFVVMHDERLADGEAVESVRGASAYLAPGLHRNVEIVLDDPLGERLSDADAPRQLIELLGREGLPFQK